MQTDKAKRGTSNANHLALGAAQNHWTTLLPPSEERSLRHCQDADDRNHLLLYEIP